MRELTAVLDDPARPLVVVLGGAKVSDKVGVIERFLELADEILIGGAMCFSFFRAQGHETGDSLVEEEGIELARRGARRTPRARACKLRLPVDLVIGASFSADAEPTVVDGVDVPDGMMGLDVGPATAAAYAERIEAAGTVFWNGPMGAFELEPFAAGDEGRRRGRREHRRDHDRRRRRFRRGAGQVRPRRSTSTGSRPAAAPRSS